MDLGLAPPRPAPSSRIVKLVPELFRGSLGSLYVSVSDLTWRRPPFFPDHRHPPRAVRERGRCLLWILVLHLPPAKS